MQVDLTSGRNLEKKHVKGKIVGRAHVGFEEEDWRFLVFVSRAGWTISDLVRYAVKEARKDCQAETVEPGETPPWMKDDWNDWSI
jgi:hypothetical protein